MIHSEECLCHLCQRSGKKLEISCKTILINELRITFPDCGFCISGDKFLNNWVSESYHLCIRSKSQAKDVHLGTLLDKNFLVTAKRCAFRSAIKLFPFSSLEKGQTHNMHRRALTFLLSPVKGTGGDLSGKDVCRWRISCSKWLSCKSKWEGRPENVLGSWFQVQPTAKEMKIAPPACTEGQVVMQ